MVLLRTYDERSVVYHRQGRIGTYAIFWNHEAMQAGAGARARRGGLDLPELPRVGDRAPARDAGRDDPLLVARPPGRLVEPGRLQRRVDLRPDRHARAARGRIAWGQKLKGDSTAAIAFFGDGATSEGSFHEGANFAGVMRAPLVLFCNNNQWAISTPLSAQTRAATLADKAIGYGMPGVRVDGARRAGRLRGDREAVERARAGDGPTFIEAVTYRCRPHATADDPSSYIDPERVEDASGRASASAATRATCAARACSPTTHADEVQGWALERDARGDRRRGGRARRRTSRLVFDHAYADPPASLADDLAELRRILG